MRRSTVALALVGLAALLAVPAVAQPPGMKRVCGNDKKMKALRKKYKLPEAVEVFPFLAMMPQVRNG